MRLKSNDDGTWRRIRVVEFLSKFTENPVDDDPDQPYQFKADKKLEDKFTKWAPVMAAMLVKEAMKNKGNVEDCSMVLAKSNEYRNNQDYLAEFVKDKIVENSEGKIKKQEVYNEFKEWLHFNMVAMYLRVENYSNILIRNMVNIKMVGSV